MLVGDLIMSVRALGPDPPLAALQAPNVGVPGAAVWGGSLIPGTYYVVVTQLNPWGESLPSTEQSVVVVSTGFVISITPDVGATSARVYIGTSSGLENNYMTFAVTPGSTTSLTFTGVGTVGGVPPATSSAYFPDSNGGFVSASTLYSWLNEALKAAARATGGIQDTCGISSVSGMRRYVVPGQWLKFDQCFYDGWELDLGNKAETFRNRNLTANIAISLMVDAQSDTTRIELYWTPSRTAGATTLSAPIVLNSFNLPINPPAGWLLADGFAGINDGTNQEVVSYSAQTASALTGCIHGWSGTQPYAFAAGAVVSELNIEINGYRMPATYSVGQSAVTLGVPPGWEPFLKDYMLGLFRGAEQETDEGEKLKASALKGLAEWAKSNKPVAGPRQCRMYGDSGIRGVVPGGLTGGIIIP
jgi:hypothetical protein